MTGRKGAKIELRLSDEERDEIASAAKEAGVSVSEYLRAAALEQIASTRVHQGVQVPARDRVEVKAPRIEVPKHRAVGTSRERTQMCEHRRPAGTYCPRCD